MTERVEDKNDWMKKSRIELMSKKLNEKSEALLIGELR